MEKPKNAEDYIAQLKAQIAMNDGCSVSHYNLAVALMGLKRYEDAEGELQEAISCSPNFGEAYVLLGGIALQRGDLDGCLYYNRQATKVKAAFSVAWGNIGFICLQKGDADEAIKALQKAIVYNSKFVQAYATLANAYLMKGLIDEAVSANMKALQLQPDFAVAYYNLALCYLEKGDYDKAVENGDKAVELGYEAAPEIVKELEKHRRSNV
jgi:tetratricopeptide (TPR) repeat protein